MRQGGRRMWEVSFFAGVLINLKAKTFLKQMINDKFKTCFNILHAVNWVVAILVLCWVFEIRTESFAFLFSNRLFLCEGALDTPSPYANLYKRSFDNTKAYMERKQQRIQEQQEKKSSKSKTPRSPLEKRAKLDMDTKTAESGSWWYDWTTK